MSTRSPLVRLGVSNLAEGEMRGYEVGGEHVLVARLGGALHALDDLCCHAGCLLSQGRREGGRIVCPCHEIAFDLATGENQVDRRLCGDQPRREVGERGGALFLVVPPELQAMSSNPLHEHHSNATVEVACFVVTSSDTRDARSDESGELLCALLAGAGHSIAGRAVVPDEPAQLRRVLDVEAPAAGAQAVIITGGTGLGHRDTTVETLEPLLEKRLDGFGELFRVLSFEEIGSRAMLSRAVAGTMRGMLVFALPGSPNAVRLAATRLIVPELGHAWREMARDSRSR